MVKVTAPNKAFIITGILLVVIFLIWIFSGRGAYFQTVPKAGEEEIADGKAKAAQYCQTCHQLPDPSMLNKEMWYTGVLPRMGPFLGYTLFRGQPYQRANDVKTSYFPSKPVLDSASWSHMIAYFMYRSPWQLPLSAKPAKVIAGLPVFDVVTPSDPRLSGTVSLTSYVKIDNSVKPARVLVGDGIMKRFYILDNSLNIKGSFAESGPIVDLLFQKDKMLACSIGQTMEANNKRGGEVRGIYIKPNGEVSTDTNALFTGLARPVCINQADLNSDGRTDYVISEFGNLVGGLSWMENKGKGQYQKHELSTRPGALRTIITDVNNDGLPDIWAQFAQGEEGIFLYTNKGKGVFDEKEVLRFPPIYGSTSFDVYDVNNDGYPDIIYTCGDNGDYTQVLKPYHGVYIFLNDGHNNFKKSFFYPINGCYKAIAKDFDGDGKIDIAAVSFFPSDHQPEEAFIFLHGKGGLNFDAYSLPVNIPFQKGITMDAADIDGDGKLDIVLGSGYFSSDPKAPKQPLVILLKNKSAKP